MKKLYNEPLISITRFSTEDIMSSVSGIPEGSVEINPIPDTGTIDELN